MNEVDIGKVAGATGESEDSIVRRGVESYVDREVREASIRINKIKDRYGVETVSELEARIESGDIEEHPAWEELIEWKNLKERIETLRQL